MRRFAAATSFCRYLDGVYVRNMSLYYDFRIVLGTVFAVVNAEGYQEGGDE